MSSLADSSAVAAAVARPAAMRFIMLTVLIDMVSIGLIIPVLPPLVGTGTARSPLPSASPTSSARRSSARCPTATVAAPCCCSASAAWR
jgi:hypothetical protein